MTTMIEQFLDRFRDNPLVTAAVAAEQQTLEAGRHADAAAIEKARADCARAEPAARKVAEEAEREHAVAKAAYEEAERRRFTAHSAWQGLSDRRDREIAARAANLRQTAPAIVEQTRDWLDAELAKARRAVTTQPQTVRVGILGRPQTITRSNAESCGRRVHAIIEGMRQLDNEISLLPAVADIEAACARLRDSLPAIETIDG